LKIISLGPAYPIRGGIAKFNESLCASLVKQGHDVSLLSYKFQYPGFLFPGKTQYANDNKPPEDLNIQSLLHSLSPFNWKKTAKAIINSQPDILIVHYWMPFFAPALGYVIRKVKKRMNSGTKVVIIAHNLIPHEWQPGSMVLNRYLLSKTDLVVTLSDSVSADAEIIRPGISRLVLPHPVYDAYGKKIERTKALQALNLPVTKKYILFFGLIRKYKGLDLLLKAMKYIEDPELHLIVAGEFYDEKDQYDAIIDEEDIIGKVTMINEYIPDNEVNIYFSAADLIVQPYKTATQSGITQIAYHFDLPMIVTRVGGLPEIVPDGECGYLVEPEPLSIANGIQRYFSHPEKDNFIQNVQKKKKEFSWENFSKKILAFFN